MKTTLITTIINGHEVVCGMGRTVVDPVQAKALAAQEMPNTAEQTRYLTKQETHRILIAGLAQQLHAKRLAMQSDQIVAAIQESTEYINYEAVKASADTSTDAGVKALADAWNAYKLKEKEICGSDANVNAALLETQEYADWLEAGQTANTEIKTAYEELLAKRRAIIENAEIFFTPKTGEEIITDEEAALQQSRLDALPEKSCLTKTGEIITDQRGEQFWYQDEYTMEWTQSSIIALGEELPATGVLQTEMTDALRTEIAEQKEDIRIDAMTTEELQAEYDQVLLSVQREAVFLRSEKELAGIDSAQALTEAQAWLAAQDAELKIKYGIT